MSHHETPLTFRVTLHLHPDEIAEILDRSTRIYGYRKPLKQVLQDCLNNGLDRIRLDPAGDPEEGE